MTGEGCTVAIMRIAAAVAERDLGPVVGEESVARGRTREDDVRHRRKMRTLVADHRVNHRMDIRAAGDSRVVADDLTQSPGCALQRRPPIEGHGFLKPTVFCRAAGLGVADVPVRRVELAAGAPMEDVALEQDPRPPVVQKSKSPCPHRDQ
jgi:hypothetical protein